MPEPSEEQWKSIDTDLLSGHKIQAIKVYREITGVGLAEAKDAVEQRHRQLESPNPCKRPARRRVASRSSASPQA